MIKVLVLLSILTLSLLYQCFELEEGFKTKQLKRRIRENKYAMEDNRDKIKKAVKAIKKNKNAIIYGNKYKFGKFKVNTQIQKNKIAIGKNKDSIGNNLSKINDNHEATESTLKTIQDDMRDNYARIPRQYEEY